MTRYLIQVKTEDQAKDLLIALQDLHNQAIVLDFDVKVMPFEEQDQFIVTMMDGQKFIQQIREQQDKIKKDQEINQLSSREPSRDGINENDSIELPDIPPTKEEKKDE